MQITVFGAAGNVGQHVVRMLLDDGHQVRVFIHKTAPFEASDLLTIVSGDVHDAAAVADAVQGSQVVISTLGSWGTPSKDIVSSATRSILAAMRVHGIDRFITLTGSAAVAPGEQLSFAGKMSHRLFGLIAPKILRDAESHLQLVAASDVRWTTLRASIIRDGKLLPYTLNATLPTPWEIISRRTVAKALIDQINATNELRSAPHIHTR